MARGTHLRRHEQEKKEKEEAATAGKRQPEPSADSGTPPGSLANEPPAPPPQKTIEITVEGDYYERLRKEAELAVEYGFIDNNHRGNVAPWVRWCLSLGEEALRQHCMTQKGYINP